uniref:Uncharacterized protein n=1 Tax=Gossypium raimondii TaxID=29730 RepID=A0A0D2LQI5_GOSRA|nr:hypothetical protein B456_001G137400 [Gossypium raimondii]
MALLFIQEKSFLSQFIFMMQESHHNPHTCASCSISLFRLTAQSGISSSNAPDILGVRSKHATVRTFRRNQFLS